MLEIRLFGTPSVLYENQPVEIPRRATRALLYYLAANGQPVGRARLATFFWPDATDEDSKARLRDQLGKLRNALPDPSLLIADRESVSLEFNKVFVDVLKFQEFHTQVSRIFSMQPPEPTIPASVQRKLVEMTELWATPGFVDGIDSYNSENVEEWLLFTRRRLENQYSDVIQRLYYHERAMGKLVQAIQWLQKALEHDPFNEQVNLLLAKTYLENGQRTAARKQFEHMQEVLGNVPDAQFPEELEAYRSEIFSQLQEIPLEEDQEWPIKESFSVPYIGQEKTLEQLKSVYRKGGSFIIFGEAGAGKTRLAQEVYHRVTPRPKLLLTACYAHKVDVSFHPWTELLQKYMSKDDWLQLSVYEASMLSILVPELASVRTDLQPIPNVITARVRHNLFDALYKALQVLSKEFPVMLFVDDLHWADESSNEMITYVLNRSFFQQANHIFLMTARGEEQNPGLKKLLQLNPNKNLEQAQLNRLTSQQVADLALHLLEGELSSEYVDQLTKKTGGNPYFVLETIQAILNSPDEILVQDVSKFPISENIYQMIQYRLQSLSADAREIIEIAAILGNHFDVSITEQTSSFRTDRFIHAIDELQTTLLITEVLGSDPLEYAFIHENIRESLLQELSSLRKNQLHNSVANAMTESAQGKKKEIAVILAYHYEKAEKYSQAIDYWAQGAHHAYQMTSLNESMRAFKHAASLIPKVDHLTDEQLLALYANWSDIVFSLDDPLEVERLNQELLQHGNERKSDLLIGTALDGLSDACFASNQFDMGFEFSEQAIPHLQRAGNLHRLLLAQVHHGVFHYMLGNLPEARKTFYAVYEQMPDNEDEHFIYLNNNLHYQIGIVEILMGYPVKGLEYLEQAITNRKTKPFPTENMLIYTAMGLGYYLKGEYRSGFEICSKAIEIGEQMEFMRMLGYAYAYSAMNAHYLGWLDQAWEHADKALAIGSKYGHIEISALAYRTMGHVHLRLADYLPAIDYFQKGIQVAGEHFAALELMTLLGHAMAAVGQVEEGLGYLDQAYRLSSQLKLGSISVYARSMMLFTQSEHQNVDSKFLEEIELALIDAKSRSIGRSIMILNAPFVKVNQRPDDYIKLMEETLHSASRLSDPLFETRILQYLIKFKKEQILSCQAETERLDLLVEELAYRAEGLPFEKAWKNYAEKMRQLCK